MVGASGSGKTTLETDLVNTGMYSKVVSSTTRPMREGEENGKDYHFYNLEDFHNLNLIESAEFGGNWYGITVDELNNDDKDICFVVEPNGLSQIKEYAKDNPDFRTITIFFSLSENLRRKNMIQGRGDSVEDVDKRLGVDTINQDWKKLGLSADILIKELKNNLSDEIHSMISTWP